MFTKTNENGRFTDFQAWKIKMLEARLYDTLLDVTETKGHNSAEYSEARVNWITGQWAVRHFAKLFPEVMKITHV